MPHINRIRVNNVKYNFGTQYYDDFLMRFSCKNTIYDLANGGGKSVLMLLLLQNLIPNCTLDDKQPIEKLFRTSEGSKTIHSLIEWKLSDAHVKNNFKYMLTGFCARKAKEDASSYSEGEEGKELPLKDNAAIEYFNYVIFYREFNDNDIKNLPLSNGKEKITYNGLKTYLRDLEKKDFGLEVRIFDRKGDYQRFIAGYGLYESHWEIIRGINKTEGHVRTYFETNYKTTRKVVEDLLIEEIIQKSFASQTATGDGEDYMAKTLLDIKDKLLELSARKEDIKSFDRQTEMMEGFMSRLMSVRSLYYGREDILKEISVSYGGMRSLVNSSEEKLSKEREKKENLTMLIKEEEAYVDGAKLRGKQLEAKQLEDDIEKLYTDRNRAKAAYDNAREELIMRESINDYDDYIYYKSQRDEIRQLIDGVLLDNGKLTGEIGILAGQVVNKLTEKKKVIESECLSEQDTLSVQKMALERDSEACKAYESKMAVLRYLADEAAEKEVALNEEIGKKKSANDFYMLTDAKEKSRSIKSDLLKVEDELNKNSEDIDSLSERENNLSKEITLLKDELEKVSDEFEKVVDLKAGLAQVIARKKSMTEIYGKDDSISLADNIKAKYRENLYEEEKKQSEYAVAKKYLARLEEGFPVGESESVRKVMEYMEKCHGIQAVSGAKYLKEKTPAERGELTGVCPILPYSIIIKEENGYVFDDSGLTHLELGDMFVPVILEEHILKADTVQKESVFYVAKDRLLFSDEKYLEKETFKMRKTVADIEFHLENISMAAKALDDDYDFARECENVYDLKIEETWKDYDLLKSRKKELEGRIEEQKKAYVECVELLNIARDMNLELQKRLTQAKREYEAIESICSLETELCQVVSGKRDYEKEFSKIKKERDDLCARIEAMESLIGSRSLKEEAFKKQTADIEGRIKEYSEYIRYEDVPYTDEDVAVLETRLKGLIGAISIENKDLSDKYKLVENYDMAMEKSLQAIDYKGLDVNDVRKAYEANGERHGRSDKDALKALKGRVEKLKEDFDACVGNISEIKSKKDRIEGALVHGIQAMEEKYGAYTSVDMGDKDVDSYIEERQAVLCQLKDEIRNSDEKLLAIQKNTGRYDVLLKDMTRVMEKAGIVAENLDIQENTYENLLNIADFEEKVTQVIERFEKYTKDLNEKKMDFEHDKQILADTLTKLGALMLAEEVKKNVNMPDDIKATDELMGSLKDTCLCLELEKGRVAKSIEDMEKIKGNFENQCIQTCVNIRNELDRLSKQSKIYMDNETISVISLSVPYVKEEQYKIRMAQYIDETTKKADEMASYGERIRYIKSRLSWKKLFSVIVTDMNAIKLSLYKRERIKEQSRYLKYEEAVGSTGQSQGIYIQFLIAIINYISAINSADKDVGLRKVIFIDNPFGAAKDIYIWEPIFKLLKANNVQLVVPARGVTPAITGKFDVNYILGQKVVDGRQQTVVVDYSSHVENDAMEYTKLEYEQTSLF